MATFRTPQAGYVSWVITLLVAATAGAKEPPRKIALSRTQVFPGPGKVATLLDWRGAKPLPPGGQFHIEVRRDRKRFALRTIPIKKWRDTSRDVLLHVGEQAPGQYTIHARLLDADGTHVGPTASDTFTWGAKPKWLTARPPVKVLNNFVFELLNEALSPASRTPKEYRFSKVQDGFVVIVSEANVRAGGRLGLTLGPKPVATHGPDTPGRIEAMRYLRAGTYSLRVDSRGGASLRRLIVRAIPDIIFNAYLRPQLIPAFRRYLYDPRFLARHILPHVNVLVGWRKAAPQDRFAREWTAQGKRWISEYTIPWKAKTVEEAYTFWNSQQGFKNPLCSGYLADEFHGGKVMKEKAPILTAAIRKLRANPAFRDKMFYAYTSSAQPGLKPLVRTLVQCRYRIAREWYCYEKANEESMRGFFGARWERGERKRWQNMADGAANIRVHVFATFSAPPESADSDPGVDYRVYLDRQFRFIATDPAFFPMRGAMGYNTSYMDEETVRWLAKLYRHYCIEGNTTPLSNDPYVLGHLVNPDFKNGTAGWTLAPAAVGGIRAGAMKQYGNLQGRYDRSGVGDTFLVTRRDAARPNVFRQTIRDLQPGRLYSFRMYVTDHTELRAGKSTRQRYAFSAKINGAEMRPDRRVHHVYRAIHDGGPFQSRKNPAWFNYYYVVFRATARQGELVISDWGDPRRAGGPADQELAFNFMQIQPYFAAED